jgi:penicillin-binding protein 2
MANRHALKNERTELQLFRTRAVVAGVLVFLALTGIIARLVNLQVVKYDYYTQSSRENYQKRIPIPPVRGQIYDRNGILLAGNNIEYVLEVVRDNVDDMNDELERISRLLQISESEIKKFRQKIRIHNRYQPVILKTNLTEKEIAIFSVNRPRFPGFEVNIRMERFYPWGSVAGHVLGYVGRIDKRDEERINKDEYKGTTHIGKSGIEKSYEKYLHGTSGYKLVEVDAHGRPQTVLEEKPPVTGADLYLSIDILLQNKAEHLLLDNGHNGAIVAIDPRNGEVWAMASVPVYDPNLFVNGISHKNYSALRDNPARPLYARAFQGEYPPGSTIKPMVALSGLNTGVTSPNKSVYGRGFFQVPGNKHRYRCWKKSGHGHIRMNRAIFQSCDVYFYDLAYRMGIDRFSEALSLFGFGQSTGIDLPHERSGLMPTAQWKEKRFKRPWYPGDTVNIGIGQGYWNATPLQLAYAVGIVGMRGKRVIPHVVRAIRSSRNLPKELIPVKTLPSIAVAKQNYWDVVIKGMINVVHGPGGTARRAGAGAKYRFAGKTGTAQVFGIAQNESYNASRLAKKLHDHSLFVAFAPAKNPQIAVSVIAENAGGGSKVAAPLARQLLDAFMFPEQLDPDKDKSEKTESSSKSTSKKHSKKKNKLKNKKKRRKSR